MPAICRRGDKTEEGGEIMNYAPSVFIEGKEVGTHPSQISPHKPWGKRHPPHQCSRTTEGSSTVFADGKPVLMVGGSTTCGHKLATGAPNTSG